MKKARKLGYLLIAWALVIMMLLSACGNKTGAASGSTSAGGEASGKTPASSGGTASAASVAQKKTPADTLVYALSHTDDNFDPADSVADWVTVISLIHDTLIYTDSKGNIYPGLATAWEWSEDHKTLHFTLREGVTFSDGSPFSGEDVLYSLQRASTTRMGGAMLSQIDFDSSYCEGSDLYIVLFKPNSEYLPYFARTFCGIVSRAYYEANGAEAATLKPVGTGPYVLSSFVEGESVGFDRNEKYWGDTPAYEHVKIKVVTEESTRAIAFTAGEIDAAVLNYADTIKTFENREAEGIKVNTVTGSMQYFLSIGDFAEAIPDVTIRKAIAHAVDWKALVQAVWGDYATVADSSAPVTSGQYYSIGVYEYDPELTQKLLEEAGYKDGITLDMAASNAGVDATVLTIVQDYLSKANITLNLTITDNATARSMSSNGEVDMSLGQNSSVSGTLTELWDPHLAGSGSLINEVHTDNWEIGAKFQEMVKEYYDIFDEAAKKEKAKEIQQYIYDNVLWIPVANLTQVIVSNDYLTNMSDFMSNWVVNNGPNLRNLVIAK